MDDPLGLISSAGSGGVSPLNPASRARQASEGDSNFKDVMLENLKKVNDLQQDATHAIEDLQTGERDDVETVLMATEKADAAFRMLLSVRNKVLDAYEEVKQTSV